MCVAPQMRHFSSRCPATTSPVAFHGQPDFLMWQMHGFAPASVLSFPTCRLPFDRVSSYAAPTMRRNWRKFQAHASTL
jgi:hypothetical protein